MSMKTLPLQLVFATCAFLLMNAPLDAAPQDYVRSDLYPAKVQSVTFYNQRFDRDHPFKIGTWTVRFGDSLPEATYHEDPDGSNAQVEIDGLVCADPGLGSFGCNFSLPREIACALLVDIPEGTFADQTDDEPDFHMIGCPRSIELIH